MSKRFGRNQRRKFRDEMAAAQARYKDLELATDEMRGNWRALQQLIRNTLRPETLARSIVDGVGVNVKSPTTDFSFHNIDHRVKFYDRDQPLSVESIQQLHALLLNVETRKEFERQLIVTMHYKDHRVCNAMSQAAFDAVPTHWITERIANDMYRLLKETTKHD